MRRLLSPIALCLTLALVSGLLYVGYSQHFGYVGFPLDDAWIHQTYARNLGRYQQFHVPPVDPVARRPSRPGA
jgi:hypothetical protein